MQNYQELVSEAYAKVKFLTEGYKNDRAEIIMFPMLCGGGNYSVKASPDAPHNYQAVIDAIHRYYKENGNDPDMKEFYERGLRRMAQLPVTTDAFQQLINIFSYQMLKEKNGEAEFKVNFDDILKGFNKNLQEKYDKLKAEDANVDEWLTKQNEIMKSNYGYSFL